MKKSLCRGKPGKTGTGSCEAFGLGRAKRDGARQRAGSARLSANQAKPAKRDAAKRDGARRRAGSASLIANRDPCHAKGGGRNREAGSVLSLRFALDSNQPSHGSLNYYCQLLKLRAPRRRRR